MSAGVRFGQLTERAKIINALVPQTQNGAAVDSLYVALTKYSRVLFIIPIGDRAGSTTPDITLTQASAADGTGAKALNFDTALVYGAMTQVADTDAPVATASDGDSVPLPATDNAMVAIEVRGNQLDIANNFTHVKCSVATPGSNNVPIAIVAIVYDGDWAGKPSTMPSVLG